MLQIVEDVASVHPLRHDHRQGVRMYIAKRDGSVTNRTSGNTMNIGRVAKGVLRTTEPERPENVRVRQGAGGEESVEEVLCRCQFMLRDWEVEEVLKGNGR